MVEMWKCKTFAPNEIKWCLFAQPEHIIYSWLSPRYLFCWVVIKIVFSYVLTTNHQRRIFRIWYSPTTYNMSDMLICKYIQRNEYLTRQTDATARSVHQYVFKLIIQNTTFDTLNLKFRWMTVTQKTIQFLHSANWLSDVVNQWIIAYRIAWWNSLEKAPFNAQILHLVFNEKASTKFNFDKNNYKWFSEKKSTLPKGGKEKQTIQFYSKT